MSASINTNNRRNNRSNSASGPSGPNSASNIVSFLLQLQIGVKMFHWQTRSYAAHAEAGRLFDKIIALTDEIVEQYMGVYGRPRMAADAAVAVPNMTKAAMQEALRAGIEYLGRRMPPDAHIRNLCDELAGEMAKALYLLTMR